MELLPAETQDTAVTAYIEIEMSEARDMEGGAAKPSQAGASALEAPKELAVFGKSFVAVLIAEWGDRTQIAMVGQHAPQPMAPAFLGAALAFFLLMLSTVGAAKLRERVVFGFSACCFALFGALALRDAVCGS